LVLQLLPCPHCGKNSLMPAETSLEASIACPHCHQQLVLAEILLGQFSSWEILHDPAAEGNASSSLLRPGVVVPVPASEEPQLELNLVEEVERPVTVPASNQLARSRGYPDFDRRPRRKTKSPLKSILPVVLGGVAAGPIALLILWHILGKDVGNLGPKIANYVPWIVPKKFHPFVSTIPKRVPLPGESGFRDFTNESPVPKRAPTQPANQDDQTTVPGQSETTEANNGSIGKTDSMLPSQPSAGEESDPVRPTLQETPKSGDNKAGTASIDPTIPSATEPTGDIFQTIRNVSERLEQLDLALQSDSLERKKDTFSQSYVLLSELIIELAKLDKQSPNYRTIQQQLQSMTATVKNSQVMQEVFNQYAKRLAPGFDPSQSPPVVISIEIATAELLNDRWLIAGTQPLDPNLIIQVPRTVAPALPEGSRWLVMGLLEKRESADSARVLVVEYMRPL
jgi:hypothetical protein